MQLVYGVQQAADPAMSPLAMWGVSPRSPKGIAVQRELEEVLQESVQRSRYVVKGGNMDPWSMQTLNP